MGGLGGLPSPPIFCLPTPGLSHGFVVSTAETEVTLRCDGKKTGSQLSFHDRGGSNGQEYIPVGFNVG